MAPTVPAALAREPAAAYPRPFHAWTIVLLLAATAILSYTDRQVLSLLVDPVRADLGVSDARMSLLLGVAFALVYGTAGIPLGRLADRASRRNLILGGMAVWSLGTIGCGLARSYDGLFAARLLVGLGEAALSPAAISLISDLFPPSRRGAAVSVYLTGIAIGIGGSILIGGGILHLVGAGLFAATPFARWAPWRLVFLAIGAVSVAWIGVIALIREPVRRIEAVAPELVSAPAISPGWRTIAPVFAVVAIASLVDNAVGAWAPTMLIRRFHADPSAIGLQLGLALMIGYGGGMLAGGALSDRVAAWRGPRGKVELCALAALCAITPALLIDAADPRAAMLAIGV